MTLGDHLAGVGQQFGQQTELYRRQVQIFTLTQYPAVDQIDGDFGEADQRTFLQATGMTAQRDPHARQQFADTKRLAEVVVCPGVERGDFVFLRIACRQHDHGNGAPLPQIADIVQPVAVRQPQIENNQIRLARAGFNQPALQRFAFKHPQAFTFQCGADETPDLFLIFDNQNIGWRAAHKAPGN